jgi:hypothetical protein
MISSEKFHCIFQSPLATFSTKRLREQSHVRYSSGHEKRLAPSRFADVGGEDSAVGVAAMTHPSISRRGQAGPGREGEEEMLMKRFFVGVSLGLMAAMPMVAAAAGAGGTRGSLPPALDQMLAQDMIQQAESNLKVAGYDPGRVDGVFDEQTATALRKYQAAHGLAASGLLDEPTRRALLPGLHGDGEG